MYDKHVKVTQRNRSQTAPMRLLSLTTLCMGANAMKIIRDLAILQPGCTECLCFPRIVVVIKEERIIFLSLMVMTNFELLFDERVLLSIK